LQAAFPHHARRNVFWINGPRYTKPAMVKLAYGNEAELKFVYSWAAILVQIPKWGGVGREIVV
jgi:hypothetical protein